MPLFPDTRNSLLLRLQSASSEQAWEEFIGLYENAIFRFVRGKGLQEADAWEVVQDVFLAVHRSIADWQSRNETGSFRAWLIRTAYNRTVSAWRRIGRQATASGRTSMHELLANVPNQTTTDPDDQDWRRWAFCWVADQVENEVLPNTWRAFWLTAVEDRPPAEVAETLGMSVGGVYAAKCRCLARIREHANQLSHDCWNTGE